MGCFTLFLSSDIATCSATLASRASVTGRSAGCLSSITERLSRAQLREKTPCPSSAPTLINSSHSLIAPDRPPSNRLHLKVRQVTKSILSQQFYYKRWHTTPLCPDFQKAHRVLKVLSKVSLTTSTKTPFCVYRRTANLTREQTVEKVRGDVYWQNEVRSSHKWMMYLMFNTHDL